jgi:hypothetical protein
MYEWKAGFGQRAHSEAICQPQPHIGERCNMHMRRRRRWSCGGRAAVALLKPNVPPLTLTRQMHTENGSQLSAKDGGKAPLIKKLTLAGVQERTVATCLFTTGYRFIFRGALRHSRFLLVCNCTAARTFIYTPSKPGSCYAIFL